MSENGEIKDGDRRSYLTNPAIALGTNMTSGMLFFSGIGYYVDHRRGSGQTWTLVGMCLGLCWCGYEVWKLVRRQAAIDARKGVEKTETVDHDDA